MSKSWVVNLSNRVLKCEGRLSEKMQGTFRKLVTQLTDYGMPKDFSHYGALPQKGPDVYHCHLNNGRPTYVVIWTTNKTSKCIDILFLGTHEKARY